MVFQVGLKREKNFNFLNLNSSAFEIRVGFFIDFREVVMQNVAWSWCFLKRVDFEE